MMGKSTVYMSDAGPSNSMNCVSYGTSLPDDPILCVIHQSLKRKQHINLMPLLKNKTNHRSTSLFHTPKARNCQAKSHFCCHEFINDANNIHDQRCGNGKWQWDTQSKDHACNRCTNIQRGKREH